MLDVVGNDLQTPPARKRIEGYHVIRHDASRSRAFRGTYLSIPAQLSHGILT